MGKKKKKKKKNKKERQLFNLLCDLENALYREDDAYESINGSMEKLYNKVERLLDKWESYFKGEKV